MCVRLFFLWWRERKGISAAASQSLNRQIDSAVSNTAGTAFSCKRLFSSDRIKLDRNSHVFTWYHAPRNFPGGLLYQSIQINTSSKSSMHRRSTSTLVSSPSPPPFRGFHCCISQLFFHFATFHSCEEIPCVQYGQHRLSKVFKDTQFTNQLAMDKIHKCLPPNVALALQQ